MKSIGEAATASGVSAKMIRHYEAIGLIENIPRNASGYRLYGEREVRTLQFIRRARDLGFSIEQMRELLALWRERDRASGDVKRLALEHVAALEHKAASLRAMIATLRDLADHCAGDDRPDCPIIAELATPAAPPPSGAGRERFGAAGIDPKPKAPRPPTREPAER